MKKKGMAIGATLVVLSALLIPGMALAHNHAGTATAVRTPAAYSYWCKGHHTYHTYNTHTGSYCQMAYCTQTQQTPQYTYSFGHHHGHGH